MRHAHGNHHSNHVCERIEILEVCTDFWDPKLDINNFQVLQLLIPTSQKPWKCTAQQLQLTRCTTHAYYYTIPVDLGRRPQRESISAIKTLALKFSPEQVSSHINQQQYYFNPTALENCYYFFPGHNWWLYIHKLLQDGNISPEWLKKSSVGYVVRE